MSKKRAFWSVIVLTFCLMLAGCQLYEGPYTFRHELSAVEKVKICTYDRITEEMVPVVELYGEEAQAIVSEFHAMDCTEYFPGDHPRNYGPIIFFTLIVPIVFALIITGLASPTRKLDKVPAISVYSGAGPNIVEKFDKYKSRKVVHMSSDSGGGGFSGGGGGGGFSGGGGGFSGGGGGGGGGGFW